MRPAAVTRNLHKDEVIALIRPEAQSELLKKFRQDIADKITQTKSSYIKWQARKDKVVDGLPLFLLGGCSIATLALVATGAGAIPTIATFAGGFLSSGAARLYGRFETPQTAEEITQNMVDNVIINMAENGALQVRGLRLVTDKIHAYLGKKPEYILNFRKKDFTKYKPDGTTGIITKTVAYGTHLAKHKARRGDIETGDLAFTKTAAAQERGAEEEKAPPPAVKPSTSARVAPSPLVGHGKG